VNKKISAVAAGEGSPPAVATGLRLDIDALVDELRALRVHSLQTRSRIGRPPKLPSRKALAAVLEGLASALFPNRLGAPELTDEGIDHYVGHTLDKSLRALHAEVRRELRFAANLTPETQSAEIEAEAARIVRGLAGELPKVRQLLDSDLRAAFQGDPAARSVDEVLVCYPGMFAITYHRIAHELYVRGVPLTARIVAEIAHSATGIDIHPGATIGHHLFLDHGTGIVIGETSVIGNFVKIYQGVTLGALSTRGGQLQHGVNRHPTIEDHVTIYSGASILGGTTVVGEGVVIGSNAFITKSVPERTRVSVKNPELQYSASGREKARVIELEQDEAWYYEI